MKLQVQILYAHNAQNRLLVNNKADNTLAIAPRFFLGQTKQGNVWRFRDDLPATLMDQLGALAAVEPPLTSFQTPPRYFEAYQKLLQAHAPISHMWQGPAYFFPDVIANPLNVTAITPQNSALLQAAFSDLIPCLTQIQPCLAIVQNSQAVSVCHRARSGRYAHEAGVETIPAYQGQGLAMQVVAAWALAVRQLGRIPLYSTAWDNIASQQVARKLGLVMYGVDIHWG